MPQLWATPVESPAEVTGVMIIIASRAQWRHLSVRPLLIWDAVLGVAVVAKTSCLLAAVDAWPAQLLHRTSSENLQ